MKIRTFTQEQLLVCIPGNIALSRCPETVLTSTLCGQSLNPDCVIEIMINLSYSDAASLQMIFGQEVTGNMSNKSFLSVLRPHI